MKYSHVASTVRDLRQLADFIEAHGLELPSNAWLTAPKISVREYINDKDEMVKAARALAKAGVVTKHQNDYSFSLTQKFGSIELEYWSSRDSVCTRKQVGTKIVEVEKTTTVKTGEKKKEPIYEWNCDPLLA